MLRVTCDPYMLSVVMLNVIMLNVVMLNVIKLSALKRPLHFMNNASYP
jgi:hypothetical protein